MNILFLLSFLSLLFYDYTYNNLNLLSHSFSLLQRLDACLEYEMETNLALSGVISKLCQIPDPLVHNYVLEPNPYPPIKEGIRTLMSVLDKVLLLFPPY